MTPTCTRVAPRIDGTRVGIGLAAIVVFLVGGVTLGALGRAPRAVAQSDPWQPVLNGLYGDVVVDVVLTGRPPSTARSMLLLPRNRGLFVRDGDGWRPVQVNPDRPYAPVLAAAVGGDDPDGRLVYAGMQGTSLFARSSNSGFSWQALGGPMGPRRIDRIASSANVGNVFAAQADRDELYHSTDHGDTWSVHPLPGGDADVDALFAAPDGPTVYTVRGGEVFRVVDEVDGWPDGPLGWVKGLGPDPIAPVTVSLQVSLAAPGTHGRLFAAGRDGDRWLVRGSIDRGDTWPTEGWPETATGVAPVALGAGRIDDLTAGVWLGLADGRVFESSDGGLTWTVLGTMPQPPTRIIVDPVTHDVWVGTEGLGLFRLKPEPVIHTGAVPVDVLAVGATPHVTETVAVLLAKILPDRHDAAGALLPALYAVFESADGDVWSRKTLTIGLGADMLVSPDYAQTHRLFSGSKRSDDGGASWRSVGSVPAGEPPVVVAMGPLTGTHPVMYGLAEPYHQGSGGAGLFQSLDGAQTWVPCDTVQTGIVAVAVSPGFVNDRTVIFATGTGFIHRARDGITFGSIGRIPSIGPLEQVVYDLAVSPGFERDNVLYVAADDPADLVQQAKVFVSGTGGQTWQARNAGLHRMSHPRTLALSPGFEADRRVFLGGLRGQDDPESPTLHASDSAGAEWFMEAFLPPSSVHDFAFVGDGSTGRLFAAASEAGLWVRDLSVPVGPIAGTPTATNRPPSATLTAPSGSPSVTPTGGSPGPSPTPNGSPVATITVTSTATTVPTATLTVTVTSTTPVVPTTPAPTGTGTPHPSPSLTASPGASATSSATREPTPMPVYLPFATRH